MARPIFNNLITAKDAAVLALKLNSQNIGGGVAVIYDNANPEEAGGLGAPFGKTVDIDFPDALMLMFKFNNVPGEHNAGLIRNIVENPINAGRWPAILEANFKDQRPADNK